MNQARRLLALAGLAWTTPGAAQPEHPPAPPPSAWTELLGEYGPDSLVRLIILENGGVLVVRLSPVRTARLDPAGRDRWRLTEFGREVRELRVRRAAGTGRIVALQLGDSLWPRRASGPDEGNVFRIVPVRPVAELRREALAAAPAAENGEFRASDLVELVSLDSTIKLEIRYATSHNFLGTPVYTQARAFLQRPAAEALVRAHRALRTRGYGLLIHDGYRPWYVTRLFWDATPPALRDFVADPASGSRHNRGCAVDLTLYHVASGAVVEMPGGYDEMSPRSHPDYPGGSSLQRWHRDLLRRALEAEGFTVNEVEWWHFDYRDWRSYGIENMPFERLRTGRP